MLISPSKSYPMLFFSTTKVCSLGFAESGKCRVQLNRPALNQEEFHRMFELLPQKSGISSIGSQWSDRRRRSGVRFRLKIFLSPKIRLRSSESSISIDLWSKADLVPRISWLHSAFHWPPPRGSKLMSVKGLSCTDNQVATVGPFLHLDFSHLALHPHSFWYTFTRMIASWLELNQLVELIENIFGCAYPTHQMPSTMMGDMNLDNKACSAACNKHYFFTVQ